MTYAQAKQAIMTAYMNGSIDSDARDAMLKRAKQKARNAQARAIRQAYADCGMVRVKGNLGGIYYE